MSDSNDKLKKNRRIQSDENAIQRQVKIAKQKGLGFNDEVIQQPHRLAKHHAMDCGQPGCVLCGNPRKIFKERTQQEKRLFQDLDSRRDVRSNGLSDEN